MNTTATDGSAGYKLGATCPVTYSGWPEKLATFLYALTLPTINLFSIPPHLKCVATLPREMLSILKATIEHN